MDYFDKINIDYHLVNTDTELTDNNVTLSSIDDLKFDLNNKIKNYKETKITRTVQKYTLKLDE